MKYFLYIIFNVFTNIQSFSTVRFIGKTLNSNSEGGFDDRYNENNDLKKSDINKIAENIKNKILLDKLLDNKISNNIKIILIPKDDIKEFNLKSGGLFVDWES
jgi:hypothetical protein